MRKGKLLAVLLVLDVLVLCTLVWKYVPSPVCISLVSGDSMLPTLKPGTLVFGVRKAPHVGDIVIVQAEDRFIIHRVIATGNSTVVTKGDNLRAPDPPVPASNVKCVITYAIFPPQSTYVLGALYFAVVLLLGVTTVEAFDILLKYAENPETSGGK